MEKENLDIIEKSPWRKRPEVIAARKIQRGTPKAKAQGKAYSENYYSIPEKLIMRKARDSSRYKTPESKEERRLKRSSPENRKKEREKSNAHYQKPEVKARRKELDAIRKADPAFKIKNAASQAKRRKNPLSKMADYYRTSVWLAFKNNGFKKRSKTESILGCSFEFLKIHLESKFQKGMAWINYGKWHVDHIIPLSSATTVESISKLCHFTNLQPLWAFDNLSKNGKIIECQPELLMSYKFHEKSQKED